MKVVVTGASGFVGRELVGVLASGGRHSVTSIVRRSQPLIPAGVREIVVAELTAAASEATIRKAFEGADAVVHLAAVTPGAGREQNARLAGINSDLSSKLAEIAASSGSRRFLYVSSALVFGGTSQGVLTEDSPTQRRDDYAASKLDGEDGIRSVAAKSAMEWTIIRPPLVYGPGVKASLGTLVRTVVRGFPLPLGSIVSNRRDMIGVRNLASFISVALGHPAAANELFVVRDGAPVSTRALIDAIAAAAERRAVLLPLPPVALMAVARLLGAGESVGRLIGNFEIDDAKSRRLLQWQAVVPMSFDIERMVAAVRSG